MRRIPGKRFAIFMAVVLCAASIPVCVRATNSTLDKLNKAKEEKEKTESQLDQANEQIDGMENVKQGLQGELSSLSSQLSKVTDNLEELERQIKDKEAEIIRTQEELDQAKEIEKQQYASMKKRIQFMYEKGETAYLEMFFSSDSFGDFLNKAEYINKVSQYDRKMLEEYQANKKKIEEEEAALVKEKKDLDAMKQEVAEQQAKVSSMVSNTSNNIAGYADQIASAEQQALGIEAQIKAQEESIAALKKQYEQELAMSRLSANSAKRDISQVSFGEGDLKMLATIIYCEAGGESYEGKLAVGAVVINRVLSSVYPDTVMGVIYQNRQFSPVASGRFELALANGTATSSCYQAAQEAMNGNTNVGGCVYFRTPIEGLEGIRIGGHIFY